MALLCQRVDMHSWNHPRSVLLPYLLSGTRVVLMLLRSARSGQRSWLMWLSVPKRLRLSLAFLQLLAHKYLNFCCNLQVANSIHAITYTIYKMSNRPTVGIIGADGASSGQTHTLPAVFSSPIRPDIVQYERRIDSDLE